MLLIKLELIVNMKIILENKNHLSITTIPETTSGNYWILDYNSKNLLNIIEKDYEEMD